MISRSLGVARDITERERANQRLALVDFALNRVKEAAYLADVHGFFHYVNDEACRALEYAHDVLLKLQVIDIDCDLNNPALWQAFWNELKVHKTMTQESCHKLVYLLHASGSNALASHPDPPPGAGH